MTRTTKTKTRTRTTRRVWLSFSSSRLSTAAPRLSTRLVGRVCLSYCWASLFVVIIGATAIVSHESQNLICVQAHPGSLPFHLPPPSYRAALNGDSNKPFRKTVKCCSYQTASSPTPCLISPWPCINNKVAIMRTVQRVQRFPAYCQTARMRVASIKPANNQSIHQSINQSSEPSQAKLRLPPRRVCLF